VLAVGEGESGAIVDGDILTRHLREKRGRYILEVVRSGEWETLSLRLSQAGARL
jgi:hypothetical protein